MTFACRNDNDKEDGNGEERLGEEEAVKLQVESHHRASQSPQSATASPLKYIIIFILIPQSSSISSSSILIFILDPRSNTNPLYFYTNEKHNCHLIMNSMCVHRFPCIGVQT